MRYQRLIAFAATLVATFVAVRLLERVPQQPGALWVLVVPVTFAFAPLISRQLKLPAALLMLLFSLIAMSVWTFYLPCAVLMFLPEKRGRPEASKDE